MYRYWLREHSKTPNIGQINKHSKNRQEEDDEEEDEKVHSF